MKMSFLLVSGFFAIISKNFLKNATNEGNMLENCLEAFGLRLVQIILKQKHWVYGVIFEEQTKKNTKISIAQKNCKKNFIIRGITYP